MQQVNPYKELKENAGLRCHPTVTLSAISLHLCSLQIACLRTCVERI